MIARSARQHPGLRFNNSEKTNMTNSGKAPKNSARKERLAAALRENLRKRKKSAEKPQIPETGVPDADTDDPEITSKS